MLSLLYHYLPHESEVCIGNWLCALQTLGADQAVAACCSYVYEAPAETPAAISLAPSGNLYWGETLLASDATSLVIRRSGAGGPFLLYTTRTHFLYTIPFSQLGQTLQATSANVSNRYFCTQDPYSAQNALFVTDPAISKALNMVMGDLDQEKPYKHAAEKWHCMFIPPRPWGCMHLQSSNRHNVD